MSEILIFGVFGDVFLIKKRKYKTPVAAMELFMSDNYCTSACYYIAGDYGVTGGNQKYKRPDEKYLAFLL